jgi:hypothetical protein
LPEPNPVHDFSALGVHANRPLLVVDVDEVLGLFMRGFESFVGRYGLEMRIDRFALFQNIYRPGEKTHIDLKEGKRLFDAFFDCDPQPMDVTPGAAEALARLSAHASVVILTNAPPSSRPGRARWLNDNGLSYPLVMGEGPKGRRVADLAALTRGVTVFIDDLLPNLESVAVEAPHVRRFQSVADERLRPYAPCAPDRHQRHDTWDELEPAIARILGVARR